jgi:hypothetical protein
MRCSACATVRVDLYFCSAEHQKLVRTSCSDGAESSNILNADRYDYADYRSGLPTSQSADC